MQNEFGYGYDIEYTGTNDKIEITKIVGPDQDAAHLADVWPHVFVLDGVIYESSSADDGQPIMTVGDTMSCQDFLSIKARLDELIDNMNTGRLFIMDILGIRRLRVADGQVYANFYYIQSYSDGIVLPHVHILGFNIPALDSYKRKECPAQYFGFNPDNSGMLYIFRNDTPRMLPRILVTVGDRLNTNEFKALKTSAQQIVSVLRASSARLSYKYVGYGYVREDK